METKNIILTTIGVLFAGFIIALIVFNMNGADQGIDTNTTTTEDLAIHEQYEDLPEENRFVEETGSQIVDRFENGSGVIFLGFKECPWCQQAVPLVNQAAEAEGVSVYYLDIRQERENNSTLYQRLLGILDPYLSKDESGARRISVPDISFVKNGEIFWRHELEPTNNEELTPDSYWTEERKEKAVQDFKEHMQYLKEG